MVIGTLNIGCLMIREPGLFSRVNGYSNNSHSSNTEDIWQNYKRLKPGSKNQYDFCRTIKACDITLGCGPAGSGKTYLAVSEALSALKEGIVKKIVLCRPAVEAGEKLGFLPGDLTAKVNPYILPLQDALEDLLGVKEVKKLLDEGTIRIMPLAYMRGRTLKDSFIILDEAQNSTPKQMFMFITRLGLGSKMVIVGDTSQTDLPHYQENGLTNFLELLQETPEIGVINFDASDIKRHPLLNKIVGMYQDKNGYTK